MGTSVSPWFEACHHPCTVLPTPSCPSQCANGASFEKEKARVGRCSFTVSKHMLKAPMVSVLEATI